MGSRPAKGLLAGVAKLALALYRASAFDPRFGVDPAGAAAELTRLHARLRVTKNREYTEHTIRRVVTQELHLPGGCVDLDYSKGIPILWVDLPAAQNCRARHRVPHG